MSRRNEVSDLLHNDLNEIHIKHIEDFPAEMETVVYVEVMDRPIFEDLELAPLGSFNKVNEGIPVTYDEIFTGARKRWEADEFGKGFRASRQVLRDDQYDVLANATGQLGDSYGHYKQFQIAQLFNRASDANPANPDDLKFLCFDLQPLLSTNHQFVSKDKRYKGPKQANTLGNVSVEPSVAAYIALLTLYNKLLDYRFRPGFRKPGLLCHSEDTVGLWSQIIDSEYNPFKDTNEINPVKARGGNIERFVWHYVADPSAYFILPAERKNDMYGLRYKIRENVYYDMMDDFDTGELKCKAMEAHAIGVSTWQGVVGQKG